jgi:hypothetical protein
MVVTGAVGILFLIYQSPPKSTDMNQAIGKIKNMRQLAPLPVNYFAQANLLKKLNHPKACPNRTENSFCTRSNRSCPAKLFTVTYNH